LGQLSRSISTRAPVARHHAAPRQAASAAADLLVKLTEGPGLGRACERHPGDENMVAPGNGPLRQQGRHIEAVERVQGGRLERGRQGHGGRST
jgi:hypothetical protein